MSEHTGQTVNNKHDKLSATEDFTVIVTVLHNMENKLHRGSRKSARALTPTRLSLL